jgi:hypothetical protein
MLIINNSGLAFALFPPVSSRVCVCVFVFWNGCEVKARSDEFCVCQNPHVDVDEVKIAPVLQRFTFISVTLDCFVDPPISETVAADTCGI